MYYNLKMLLYPTIPYTFRYSVNAVECYYQLYTTKTQQLLRKEGQIRVSGYAWKIGLYQAISKRTIHFICIETLDGIKTFRVYDFD